MNTLFGILLIVCSVFYSIRFFSWLYIITSKERLVLACTKTGQSPIVLCLGGIEHIFFMVSMIGGSIILL